MHVCGSCLYFCMSVAWTNAEGGLYFIHSSGAPLNVFYFNCIVQVVVCSSSLVLYLHNVLLHKKKRKIQRAFHGISVHLKFQLDGNMIEILSAQSFQIICILHVLIVD